MTYWRTRAQESLRDYEQIQAWIAEGRVGHPQTGFYLSHYLAEYQDRHSRDMLQAARKERQLERDRLELERKEREFAWLVLLSAETARVTPPRHMRRRLRGLHREDCGFTGRQV